MYALTSILCMIGAENLDVKSEDALKDITSVMKAIFTPVNSIIVLATLGNVFSKVKDKVIDTNQAGKRIIILLIIFIIILVFETSYIGGFIQNLLT